MARGALLITLVASLSLLAAVPTTAASGWNGCVEPVIDTVGDVIKKVSDPTSDPQGGEPILGMGDCSLYPLDPEACACEVEALCGDDGDLIGT